MIRYPGNADGRLPAGWPSLMALTTTPAATF
jgi:hypothetical protein